MSNLQVQLLRLHVKMGQLHMEMNHFAFNGQLHVQLPNLPMQSCPAIACVALCTNWKIGP